MPVFSPPTDNLVVYDGFDPVARRLFRRVTPGKRGRNVFLLIDGTYTENQPRYWSDVDKVYYGGMDHQITAAEQASLTAAGYGDFITP